MIIVRAVGDRIERLAGNPVIKSLDGERKAPLRVIMHESWAAKDRAKYGVYIAKPMTVPKGKQAFGAARFERKHGAIVEVRELRDAPQKKPNVDRTANLQSQIDDLKQRLEALEN